MTHIADFPYAEIEFTKEGTVFQPAAVASLLQLLAQSQTTDLLVVSHGWNNDMNEARDLYQQLISGLAIAIHRRPALTGRHFAVLGVLWPAKKFTDDELIAGGAAGLDDDPATTALLDRLTTVQAFFDSADSARLVQEAIDLAPGLATDENARTRYVDLIRQLISRPANAPADEPEDLSASHVRQDDNPTVLLTNLSTVRLADSTETAEGGAADLNAGSLPLPDDGETGGAMNAEFSFRGLIDGARNLLNFATYYQMKERAGKVGLLGLQPVLAQVRQARPACRLHLIGHSFGARVVSAAAAGPVETVGLPVQTLSLLQGAFSHYGFAQRFDGTRDGLFRSVLTHRKVTGPVLVSQTHNDKAVGIAYAVASRIAGQIGAFLGDANDRFGGLGANGAQLTPEASTQFSLDPGAIYAFKPGVLYNLNADQTIPEHSSIFHPQVAQALASALEVN